MNDVTFKKILENICTPVCVSDENGEIIFSNVAYDKLTEIQRSKLLIKEIFVDDKKFIMQTSENSSEQVHQDFISTVSHELRTPLTSIRGFADTMLMASDKLSKEQQHKFLTIIRNQSDRLTRLVENLLEVSNISQKTKLIFKELDFVSFIQPIITIFEKKYPNKQYKTDIMKNLPYVWSDGDLLEQILTNLIDNASKYSPDNATVTIKAEYHDNSILIKIIDEAVKIPENQLCNIFNKFSRIDNPLTRKVEGSGLGLFITKSLVEKISGSIKAENYEKGNIFILKLEAKTIEQQISSKISGDRN